MIGLVDYDFQINDSINLTPPNVQIMKIANYYKTQENKFCKIISLNEQDLSGYQKIYFFSEKQKYPDVPPQFLQQNNVKYGGTAFTNGIYIPFENSIIDYTIPRINIYGQILKEKYNDGIKSKVIQHILNDSYYRIYAGENKLPIPPIIPRKRIYIYDINFFYDDWKEIIQELIDRKTSIIITIHPIRCKTITQYAAVRAFPKIARTNEILLDLDVPLDQVYYLLKVYKKLFIADITKTSNVFLPIGGTFNTPALYRKDIIYKLNLLYSFWSCNIPIKLKYEYPHLGTTDPIYNLSKRIQTWANNETKQQKSIKDSITRKNKKKKTIELQELEYLLKFIPSGKTLFDQTAASIRKGGLWRI